MSHSALNFISTNGGVTIISFTIVNYVLGGEPIPLPELNGLNAPDAVWFQMVAPGDNSLGQFLMPIFSAGKVLLVHQDAAFQLVQVPTTVGLNALIVAIIHTPN